MIVENLNNVPDFIRTIKGLNFYVGVTGLSDQELYSKYLECESSEGGHRFWEMVHFECSDTGEEEFCCRHCKLIEHE